MKKGIVRTLALGALLVGLGSTAQAQTFSNLTVTPTGGGSSHIPYAPNGDIYLTAQTAGSKTGQLRFRTFNGSSYQQDRLVVKSNGGIESRGDLRFTPDAGGNSSWLMHTPDNGSGIMYLGHNNKGTTGWQWDYQFRQTHMYAKAISIGTGTLPSGYRLSVDGKIMAEEVHVQNSSYWPDFVFADDYDLQDLGSVNAYIQANRHLPGVPSATEVEENGYDLGEMNKILLQKIEELTLHTIRQQEQIEALQAQVAGE